MSKESKNTPDYNVYAAVPDGTDGRGRPQWRRGSQMGVAWRHQQGDGINIVLDGHAVHGRYVIFSPKDQSDETT